MTKTLITALKVAVTVAVTALAIGVVAVNAPGLSSVIVGWSLGQILGWIWF